MKIENLTEEQESILDSYAQESIDHVLGGDTSHDVGEIVKLIGFLYDGNLPEIVICNSPTEMLEEAEKGGSEEKQIDWLGLGYDSGWTAFARYFRDKVGIDYEDIPFREFDDALQKSGVFGTLLFENVAFVCVRPCEVHLDEKGELHNSEGPAIVWLDDTCGYFWHGTKVPAKLIMKPSEITREEIMAEKNSEVSRAIAEKLGWDEYMKRADTVLVDKWFDEEKVLHYELWDFKKRFELTPRLLKMESPVLNDGTQPHYVEAVDPNLKTCKQARRWQFMLENGEWPSVDYCVKNSELSFEVEA